MTASTVWTTHSYIIQEEDNNLFCNPADFKPKCEYGLLVKTSKSSKYCRLPRNLDKDEFICITPTPVNYCDIHDKMQRYDGTILIGLKASKVNNSNSGLEDRDSIAEISIRNLRRIRDDLNKKAIASEVSFFTTDTAETCLTYTKQENVRAGKIYFKGKPQQAIEILEAAGMFKTTPNHRWIDLKLFYSNARQDVHSGGGEKRHPNKSDQGEWARKTSKQPPPNQR